MSKEKLDIHLWLSEDDFMEGPCNHCLEIFSYLGEGSISVYFHDELVAEIYHEDDPPIIHQSERLVYRLGILYYDFVRAMKKIDVSVERLESRFTSLYAEEND